MAKGYFDSPGGRFYTETKEPPLALRVVNRTKFDERFLKNMLRWVLPKLDKWGAEQEMKKHGFVLHQHGSRNWESSIVVFKDTKEGAPTEVRYTQVPVIKVIHRASGTKQTINRADYDASKYDKDEEDVSLNVHDPEITVYVPPFNPVDTADTVYNPVRVFELIIRISAAVNPELVPKETMGIFRQQIGADFMASAGALIAAWKVD